MNEQNKWNELHRKRPRIEMVVGTYKLANERKQQKSHDAIDSNREQWRQWYRFFCRLVHFFHIFLFSVNEVWHDIQAVLRSYNNPLAMMTMPYRSFHEEQIKLCPQTYIRNHNEDVHQ